MKLLIQADDYGITRAVSSGIVFGIHHGLVRNTGIFTNMDWTEECLDMIKPYLDQIDLGIDLNISTGRPILPTYQIPTLVNQEGIFLTSWENEMSFVRIKIMLLWMKSIRNLKLKFKDLLSL